MHHKATSDKGTMREKVSPIIFFHTLFCTYDREFPLTTARVTIENFWARCERDAGETRARRGRELSQISTLELFILGIWACK